jgi:hypothetical protein
MEVLNSKAVSASGTGDRDAHPNWEMRFGDDKFGNYDDFFKQFFGKLMDNNGTFKVDGSLFFEFMPKAKISSRKLISPETSFFFHKMEEGSVYSEPKTRSTPKYKDSAIENYDYQKRIPPMEAFGSDGFMPTI